MTTHLDIGNHFIYDVMTPVNNDQGANKHYADQKVAKFGDTMSGTSDISGNKIIDCGDAKSNTDVININFYNKWAPFGGRDSNQNFDCKNKTLYNNYLLFIQNISPILIG